MSIAEMAQASYRRQFVRESGYKPLYRTGSHCPSCGSAGWIIGRLSAECGRCGTALPLAPKEPSI